MGTIHTYIPKEQKDLEKMILAMDESSKFVLQCLLENNERALEHLIIHHRRIADQYEQILEDRRIEVKEIASRREDGIRWLNDFVAMKCDEMQGEEYMRSNRQMMVLADTYKEELQKYGLSRSDWESFVAERRGLP